MNDFIEFESPEQVKKGAAVVLRAEATRFGFCPFATLLVVEIIENEYPNLIQYTLMRPYLNMVHGTGATAVGQEIVKIHGFKALRERILGHNSGRGLYVMSSVGP